MSSFSPRKKAIIGSVVVAVLMLGAALAWYQHEKKDRIQAFPINSADTISSWSFKGAYTGNDTLEAQARADITHLTALLGTGQYDDYDLYNGMGNDYLLLGDGRSAYNDYNKAISIYPDKGLVYTNVGHLMNLLGANQTAADAYAKAVHVEPSVLQYHLARLDFLTKYLPKDNAAILAALTDSSKQFGDTAPVLAIEAQWLTDEGRYSDAISAWKQAKMLSPGKDTSAMDAAITHLEAKEAAAK